MRDTEPDRDADTAFLPSYPPVEAKLHPPAPRSGIIPRERLVRLLAAEPQKAVVSVIAPPGYGKTVLLAQWAAQERRPVAWLTLDDFDNVPSVLLSYLAVAVDRIRPGEPSLRDTIVAAGPRLVAAAVPRLASALHEVGRPAVLVLDDVHRLTDPDCLDALAALLDHLPPDFRVVLAARTTAGLPLARLRARRDLLEIGASELAFDACETVALTSAAGHPVSRDEARALTERTEGWATGIYLTTLAWSRAERPGRHIEGISGGDEYIADYLRSELLDHLDDEDVTFLVRSSILEIVEPASAEAVAGLPGAAARLRRLATANRLVIRAGGSGTEYRYHHLFRGFLLAELEQREPGSGRELHRRASACYRAAGRAELAIEHALLGDRDTAAEMVSAAVLPMLFGGRSDQLVRWLDLFTDAEFERYPPLAVTGAWMHALNGRAGPAERLADILERSSFDGSPGDGSATFESGRAQILATMARRGPEDMLANASIAVAAEPPGSPWRTNALLMLGAAHLLLGDRAAAAAALEDAVDAGATAGMLAVQAILASIAIEGHDWAAAERHAREGYSITTRSQLGLIATSLWTYAIAARIAIHRGDLERARQEIVRAQLVRPMATHATPWYSISALLELAGACLALSDPAGARSAVAEAEAILRRRPALGILGARVLEMRRRLSAVAETLAGSSSLSNAELKLLPVLATPLTFKEIGDRVYLSHHTVKTHAMSIYGKLGASSRSEAVERAIELGLLEPFPTLGRSRRAAGG